MKYTGSCYCRAITYEIDLVSPDDARTSICHSSNCKRFTGTENSVTAKIPRCAFTYTMGVPKKHESDNGSGTLLTREFCADCGSGIMEYGSHAGENTYVFHGTLDNPTNALPPKGEFFMKYKAPWMPEIPNVFHKYEIKT